MNISNFETSIQHFADAVSSIFKGLVHAAAVLAPLAAQVANATGNTNVGDIAKQVGDIANHTLTDANGNVSGPDAKSNA